MHLSSISSMDTVSYNNTEMIRSIFHVDVCPFREENPARSPGLYEKMAQYNPLIWIHGPSTLLYYVSPDMKGFVWSPWSNTTVLTSSSQCNFQQIPVIDFKGSAIL